MPFQPVLGNSGEWILNDHGEMLLRDTGKGKIIASLFFSTETQIF